MNSDDNQPSLAELFILHEKVVGLTRKYLMDYKLPIRIEQIPVLKCVGDLGMVSQQEIANVTMRDKSSIQRTVVNLLEKGLIAVSTDRMDKRKNIISLTESGKSVASMLKMDKILKGIRTSQKLLLYDLSSVLDMARKTKTFSGLAH